MQAKLIGYQHRDTVIHRLSGAGKLLFFILVSLAAMISYDTRLLVLIAIFFSSICQKSALKMFLL